MPHIIAVVTSWAVVSVISEDVLIVAAVFIPVVLVIIVVSVVVSTIVAIAAVLAPGDIVSAGFVVVLCDQTVYVAVADAVAFCAA